MKKIIVFCSLSIFFSCQNQPAPTEEAQEKAIQEAIKPIIADSDTANVVVRDEFSTPLKGWQLPFNEKEPKTVEDYYYMMPSELFFEVRRPLGDGVDWRKKQLKVLDIKNGYVKAKTEFETFEMALFKDRKRGKDLIVVLSYNEGGGYLSKYEVNADNEMAAGDVVNKDVSSQMDKYFEVDGVMYGVDYTLPQKGTTIRLEYQGKKARLEWEDGEFVFKSN